MGDCACHRLGLQASVSVKIGAAIEAGEALAISLALANRTAVLPDRTHAAI